MSNSKLKLPAMVMDLKGQTFFTMESLILAQDER